jgi:lipopolysaccharide exporter
VSLAKKTVLGAIWSIASSIGSMVIGLVGTIWITNLLAPEVVGDVAIAIVIVQTAGVFSSFGFGQYLVANPKAGPDVAFHAALFHLVTGLLAMGLVYVFRAPLAEASGTPGAAVYIPGVALFTAIDRFIFIPARLLVRDMRFGALGAMNTIGELLYALVAIGTASIGWGGQAIIAGNVVRVSLQVLVVFWAAGVWSWARPHTLSMETTRKLLRFGLPLAPASILHYGAMKWDNTMIGAFFGNAAVGLYTRAYNLADIPANRIGEQIGDVLVPSFAQMEHQDDRRRALVRAVGVMALVITPLAVGLGAVAHTLIAAIFNPEWASVAPMLVILSALSVLRPVGWLIMGYLQAQARTRTIMVLESVKVAALLGCMAALSYFGLYWACVGVGVGFALHAVASLYAVHRVDGMSMMSMVRPSIAPILASVPMVGAVLGVRYLLQGRVPSPALLVIEVAAGGIAYVPSAFLIANEASREVLNLLKKVRNRKAERPPAPAQEPSPAEATTPKD